MGLCQIQCRQIVNQNHTHIKPSSHRVTRSNTFYEKCTFAISVRQIDVEFWDTNILYIYIDTHITHTRAKTIDILHRTSAYLPYVVGIFVNFYIFCQLSKTKQTRNLHYFNLQFCPFVRKTSVQTTTNLYATGVNMSFSFFSHFWVTVLFISINVQDAMLLIVNQC